MTTRSDEHERFLIDVRATINDWISAVRSQLIPRIESDARFKSSDRLFAQFEKYVSHWQTGGQLRQMMNAANELAVVAALLGLARTDDTIHYEVPLRRTEKKIDFLLLSKDGSRSWFEVKSVSPQRQQKAVATKRKRQIEAEVLDQIKLIVCPSSTRNGFSFGPGVSFAAFRGEAVNARWTFVDGAAELEKRISLLQPEEKGTARLVLCSNGLWGKDDLEDFADFYQTGSFRADDWARHSVARHIADHHTALTGSIDGFCYLERRDDEAEARCFDLDIRGPDLFGPLPPYVARSSEPTQ